MIWRIRQTRFALFVTLALMLALTLSGFAHRAPALSPDLAAYAAAGGDLDDLCRQPGRPDHAGQADCAACRLMGAAQMPEPVALSVVLRLRADLRPERSPRAAPEQEARALAPPVRGPPLA